MLSVEALEESNDHVLEASIQVSLETAAAEEACPYGAQRPEGAPTDGEAGTFAPSVRR